MFITEKISERKVFKKCKAVYLILFCLSFFVFAPSTAEAQKLSFDFSEIAGGFDNATSIDITPTGIIYIIEQNSHRLIMLNREGVRIDSIGNQGSGRYQFDRPQAVDATNGLKIYVADKNNSRIQIFDRRQQYLSSITVDKIERVSTLKPYYLAVSASNQLYVFDQDRFVIHKFDSNGHHSNQIDLRQFGVKGVTQLKIANDMLMILDSREGVLHRFRLEGPYINFVGGFQDNLAFYGTSQHLWTLTDGVFAKRNFQGSILESYILSRSKPFIDLAVHENHAYFLTSDRLFKAELR